jgi:hypothetical protein
VRVNFNYFISEAVFDYVVRAVRLVARDGWRMLGAYRFDLHRCLWTHREGAVEPPLRLGQVGYGPDGEMRYPRHRDTAPESALADYLVIGEHLLQAVAAPDLDAPTELPAGFEDLRWFELPPPCLVTTEPATSAPV